MHLIFQHGDAVDFVTLLNLVDHVQTVNHFAKNRMVAVEVGGILAVVADEKLRTARIPSPVSHRKNPPIVVLVFAGKFTINGVAWSASTGTRWVAPLDHEIRNDTVKFNPVVKTLLSQRNKVIDRFRGILLEELDEHRALVGIHLCLWHD